MIASLTNELLSNIKPKLLTKLGSKEGILDDSIEQETLSKKFSKEIGTESKDISLNLNLKVSSLVFRQDDFIRLIKETISQDIKATSSVTLYYIPVIDSEAIKKELAGKSYQDASTYLSNYGKIGGMEIIREKNLLFFGDRLPYKDSSITIQVNSN